MRRAVSPNQQRLLFRKGRDQAQHPEDIWNSPSRAMIVIVKAQLAQRKAARKHRFRR